MRAANWQRILRNGDGSTSSWSATSCPTQYGADEPDEPDELDEIVNPGVWVQCPHSVKVMEPNLNERMSSANFNV